MRKKKHERILCMKNKTFSRFFPKLEFSTFKDFFEEADKTQKKLMTWEGELYLEAHNGTYTSMSKNKHYNRCMEILLRDVEMFVYFSTILFKEKFGIEEINKIHD